MSLGLYFLDTSALVKLYVLEPGTDQLLQLIGDPVNRFVLLALSPVEVRSAIRRRERLGDLDRNTANFILDRLRQHLETIFPLQILTNVVLDAALEIIDRYALRAYGAIQLAGCLTPKATSGSEIPAFVCADQQLLNAARSELLAVVDPCASR